MYICKHITEKNKFLTGFINRYLTGFYQMTTTQDLGLLPILRSRQLKVVLASSTNALVSLILAVEQLLSPRISWEGPAKFLRDFGFGNCQFNHVFNIFTLQELCNNCCSMKCKFVIHEEHVVVYSSFKQTHVRQVNVDVMSD